MKHNKGKVYITKIVIIDTKYSDVVHLDTTMESINEVVGTISSSPMFLTQKD